VTHLSLVHVSVTCDLIQCPFHGGQKRDGTLICYDGPKRFGSYQILRSEADQCEGVPSMIVADRELAEVLNL
jgi:hypothetical protein